MSITTDETRAMLGTIKRAAASAHHVDAEQRNTRTVPERSRAEWQQIARECLQPLKDAMHRLNEEKRVLREVFGSREDELGGAGRRVMQQEIWRREHEGNRIFSAHSLVHTIACAIDRDLFPHRNLEAIQDVAEWFDIVELAPTREILEAHQEAAEEVAAPPKPRCPHAHIIRRFAKMAEIRGHRMDDTDGRREAFSKFLGRPLKSCSELTASEWEAGMIALREGRLAW